MIRAVDGPLVSVYGLRPEAVSYNAPPRCSSTCGSPPAARCATSSSRSRSSSSPREAARGGHRRAPPTRTPGSRTERSEGVLWDRLGQSPPELLARKAELRVAGLERGTADAQPLQTVEGGAQLPSWTRAAAPPWPGCPPGRRRVAPARGRRAPRARRTRPRRSPCRSPRRVHQPLVAVGRHRRRRSRPRVPRQGQRRRVEADDPAERGPGERRGVPRGRRDDDVQPVGTTQRSGPTAHGRDHVLVARRNGRGHHVHHDVEVEARQPVEQERDLVVAARPPGAAG